MKKIILFITAFIFLGIYLGGELTVWEDISVCLFIYFFCSFLYDLGKKIVVLDFIIIMIILTCLIMPVVFYHIYTKENFLARLWIKYMPITSDEYFSFTVPGTLALILGLRLPIGKKGTYKDPGQYIENVKRYLALRPNLGLQLMGVGVISGLLNFLAPDSLKQVFYLMAHLTFVGVFYVIYSPSKHKRLIVPGVILLMIGQSVATGMFGEFIYILSCSLVLILLGKNISFRRKLVLSVLGIFLIMVIQSIKREYRLKSWNEGSGDALYFAELVTNRVTNPSTLFDPNALFYASVRMNQGWLVAETMKLVPDKHPFGGLDIVWQSVAASIAPRFLWPDKPEAGGKYNLKRFWGYDLVGWSTNIGTLGEAYANFNRFGGIIYMLFYGIFFSLVLTVILRLATRTPTLILWLPYLFFASIVVETDLLTTMGALLKGVFFTWIVYRAFHIFFRINL